MTKFNFPGMKAFLIAFLTINFISARKSRNPSAVGSDLEIRKYLDTKFQVKGAIWLTDNNFTKFVSMESREYNALVMITTTDSKYGCSICHKGINTLSEVGLQYASQYSLQSDNLKERLAFFIMDIDSSAKTSQQLRIGYVPTILLFTVDEVRGPRLEGLEINYEQALDSAQDFIAILNELLELKVR